MHVAVIGGGLAGVTLAALLNRAGVRADVYEKAPAFNEVGAGVHLSPNSLRVLAALGPQAWDAICRLGSPGESLGSLHHADGTEVMPASGPGGRALHRADLLAILVAALPADALHAAREAVAVRQSATRATVTFSDGNVLSADVVIGADGINSVVRGCFVEPSRPQASGYLVYRGVIRHQRSSRWPADLHRIWMGDGQHFVTYPIRQGAFLTHVAFVRAERPLADPRRGVEVRTRLASQYAGWDPLLLSVIAEIGPCLRLEVFDRPALKRWAHGRVALIGDAAHAMLPHIAQGANQALEDAGALATLLAARRNGDAPRALTAYERVRLPRATRIQRMSRRFGTFYDSNGSDMSLLIEDGQTVSEFLDWLYGYDVIADAQATL